MKNNALPLAGLKVIDLGIHVAAPACSSLLGYFGADVVKVETVKGDPYRIQGATYGLPCSAEENPLFDTINDFKRSIALNLRTPEGKAVMTRLVEQADILVTNYRDSALAGMGFTYEDVKRINPRCIYASLLGYGDKGPDAARPAYDSTAFFARSGFMYTAQYPDLPPMITPAAAGDTVTSMAMVMGIMAAYLKRLQTGEGSHITSSLLGTAMWVCLGPSVLQQFAKGPRKHFDIEHPSWIAICTDYKCKCGTWVRFCCMSVEQYWPNVCRALGLEQFIDDPRFNTMGAAVKNSAACYAMMQDKLLQKTYEEWEPIFKANDLPVDEIASAAKTVQSEQAIANGFSMPVHYEESHDIYLAMPPVKIEGMPETPRTHSPKHGEHTVQVLMELGYSQKEIDALLAGGAAKQYE